MRLTIYLQNIRREDDGTINNTRSFKNVKRQDIHGIVKQLLKDEKLHNRHIKKVEFNGRLVTDIKYD